MITDYKTYISNLLNEGLIHTTPISNFYNSLINSINFINNDIIFEVNPNFNNETFVINIKNNISIIDIKKIDSICNNYGYFINQYKVYREMNFNTFKSIDKIEKNIENNIGIDLYYESKLDSEIIVPDKIYHATNITHLPKIDKYGLSPRTTSKLRYHGDRIYFSLTYNDCINIIPMLCAFDKNIKSKDYIILEIDTNDFYNVYMNGEKKLVKFRNDSQTNGIACYTTVNIPRDRIVYIDDIITTNNIIKFDEILINKKEISAKYLNNIVYNLKLK